jgi:hypothetical protein
MVEEKLQIITRKGAAFEGEAQIYVPTGKITYLVEVQGEKVRFGGNPEIGGLLIIPYTAPVGIDPLLLEDIALAIEQALF